MSKIAKNESEILGESPKLPESKRKIFGKSSQASISSNFHPIASDFQEHQICPQCGSKALKIGAGRKPGEESRRCGGCGCFLGYCPISRIKRARRRKKLTECLQILENQGIRGEFALFALSLVKDGGEA